MGNVDVGNVHVGNVDVGNVHVINVDLGNIDAEQLRGSWCPIPLPIDSNPL